MTLQRVGLLLLIVAVVATLPACAAITGIFKAGVGVGIFIAIVVVGLIFFLVSGARA
jgi:hypothetical protein